MLHIILETQFLTILYLSKADILNTCNFGISCDHNILFPLHFFFNFHICMDGCRYANWSFFWLKQFRQDVIVWLHVEVYSPTFAEQRQWLADRLA